ERPTRLTLAAACFLRAARRLRSLPRIDVVVAHFLLPSALLSPARGALEVVGHGSDVRLLTALPAPLRRGIVAALLRRHATFRFASSAGRRVLCEALPQELAHRLLAASRVELPPIEIPPIDPERRRRRRAELCASDETLVAICGRLVASKRFGLALEAAGSIGAVALVIGDGPDRAALERRSRELGLRARFVGRRPRPEALLDLSCADLLVHPSAHEGAPTVIREARALGVPVVCCPSGDVAAWADDDDDLVVVSEALLAEALGALVKSRGRTISRCASVR
ncbi:MAG TPA: glycosyltransferase, partial [Polyangiaceae bacterium]|nr:glycosyltransferase [Polyangiaceae bacterium]